MKNKKLYKSILMIGVLMVSLDFILKRNFNFSDELNGFIIGFGLGLEILSLILLRREQLKRL